MRLIVGLGNPGPEYANQRHNLGFMAVDEIHRQHPGFGPWRSKFQAEISEGRLDGEKVLLMKPMTYMNESGRAVGEAVRFFKLQPEEVIVLYDEIDLAAGKMRVKLGGGAAGHNGIRSITAHIGPYFQRVRVGVGHPGRKDMVSGHVLHDFSKADAEWRDPMIEAIAANIGELVRDNDALFSNKVHVALGTNGRGKKQAGEKPEKGTAPEEPPARAETVASDPGNQGPLAGALSRLFQRKKD